MPDKNNFQGKIIAVDFDGTLCANAWPSIGSPNLELFEALRKARSQGAHLILWTCRTGSMLKEAVMWCRGYGLYFDSVNEDAPSTVALFGGDGKKVYADIYIDDKAATPKDFIDFPNALLR